MLGVAFDGDVAGLQHVGAVRDGQRQFSVLLHQQDRDALFVAFLDDLENLLDQQRGQAHRRLIHQNHLGLSHQGAAHGQHLLLTAGKGACQLAFALFQAGEPLVDIGHRFGHIGRIRESSHLQVLFHRHLGEDVPSFRHMRQL